jgi:tetratricopeptide (TPR) repeat protein
MFSKKKKIVQEHSHPRQGGRRHRGSNSLGLSDKCISKEGTADFVLINSLFKAGSRYQQKRQYTQALARYQELKDLFSELVRPEYELVMRRDAHVSFLVGMIHEAQEDFVKAMDHYSDAVKIYRENRILIAEYGTRHPKENIQPTLLKVNFKLVQVMACMGSLQPRLNLTKWDFALNINSTALKLLDAVVHQCPEIYDTAQSKVIRESLESNITSIRERKSYEEDAGRPAAPSRPAVDAYNFRDDDYTIDTNVPFRDLILKDDDQVSIDSSVSGLTKLIRDDANELKMAGRNAGVAEALVTPFLFAGEKAFDAIDGALAALDGGENKKSKYIGNR